DRSPRPDDDATQTITGRRPIVEAVVAAAAEDQPRVTVRRGVRISGLLPGPVALAGVPHVAGVTTSSGEQLAADLVIDAMGRRSPSPAWLATLGARPPGRTPTTTASSTTPGISPGPPRRPAGPQC
ncbi:MAG: tryptophan 7-halogenase, partial [Actinomycetota bacterium]|nr:tryptophan 7-halogenase [Actinomycetota bacterium]